MDEVAARKVHEKLVSLCKQLTILPAMQSIAVEDIDDYIKNPTPEGWIQVRLKLSNIFNRVNDLLETLSDHDSDFVIGPVYKQLNDTLRQRVRLLEKLEGLPPPVNKEELTQLRNINERYKKLIEEMNKARDELASYLEQQRARSTSKAQ